MSNTKHSRTRSILTFLVSIVLVAVASLLFFNRQLVLDTMAVWSYEPTRAMAAITERVGFTKDGERIFYATKPALESADGFNSACPRQETNSPILGCYTADSIYIYDITNHELDGMEEVTAAHEMLHAAWARTSGTDKEKLETKLRAAYEKLDEGSIKDRMDYYSRTEPTELTNELHSILGTEVPNLDASLETYYSQFFNRTKVLALHDQYNSVYTSLQGRATELFNTMNTLSTSIQSRSEQYDSKMTQLSADVDAFNTRASNGSFASQAQFNNERAELLRRTSELETERTSLNTDIDAYNRYFAEYEEIAKKLDLLNSSIDSFNKFEQVPAV
ncbi:MAG: hypothetical protein ACREGE_01225 [Candidatus Microsaccharimonas sp.]